MADLNVLSQSLEALRAECTKCCEDDRTHPRLTRMPILHRNVGDLHEITTAIVGVIGDPFDYEPLLQALYTATTDTTIRILCDTTGGRVDTAAIIANAIKNSAGRVVGVAHGQTMSSASTLVFAACNAFEIRPGANFMFHGTTHNQQGKSIAIRDYAITVIDYITMCLKRVVELGMLTDDELTQILDKRATIFLDGQTVKARMLAKGVQVL